MPRDRLAERLARCVAGLVLCGLGIAAILHAELGVSPWDVLHQGISERTGIPIGMVIVLVGAVVLLLWWPLRMRPGVGTLLNAVLIGVVVDVADPLLPELTAPSARIAALAAGIVALGVGSGLYIGSGLGTGPRDGLMTGLAGRGISIRLARTGIELAALAAGWVLGGSVGVGTAAFALTIGPIVHVCLPRLEVGAAAPTVTACTAAASASS